MKLSFNDWLKIYLASEFDENRLYQPSVGTVFFHPMYECSEMGVDSLGVYDVGEYCGVKDCAVLLQKFHIAARGVYLKILIFHVVVWVVIIAFM